MAWRGTVRRLADRFKFTALAVRREAAAGVLAEAARGNWGWRGRGLWTAYLAKRCLQALATREWPFRRGLWSHRVREWRSVYALKLAQWADRAPGWAPQPYAAFRRNNALLPAEAEAQRASCAAWPERPLFGLVTAVHNATPEWLDRLAASVLAQTYDRWEWTLVDDASAHEDTWRKLREIATRDSRIVVERRAANGGVVVATNRAAEMSSGAFLAFVDHDDELTPDALWHLAERVRWTPDADLLYSDEEIVPEDGPPYPMLKPAFSPELLLSFNYMCHFVALRREVWDAVGGLRIGTEGVQDYDLLLRAMPKLRRVEHLPRVLYRWHATAESLSRTTDRHGRAVGRTKLRETTQAVVQRHLERAGAQADAEILGDWVRPHYRAADRGLVSIVICSKDQPKLLAACVRSVAATAGYPQWELLLVDNESQTSAARRMFARLTKEIGAERCRVLRLGNGPEGFNWSKLNNAAAKQAKGEHLLFLNDDIAGLAPGWLAQMVGAAGGPVLPHPLGGRGGVGAVGAMLQYPSGAIQHAGVICGAMGWGPWHALMGVKPKHPTDHQGWIGFPRNLRAVTGACLLTPRKTFERLGGFDETELRVAFSDIDYCLRVGNAGERIAYLPTARLLHRESQSRGTRLAGAELAAMAKRSRGVADPYWHPARSRENQLLELDSRRRSRGLLFRERPPRIGFLGPAEADFAAPSWRGLARKLAAAGRCVPVLCPVEGDAAAALRAAEAEHAPDAWFIQGSAAANAVAAALAPVVWHLPERLLVRDGTAAETLRVVRVARALRFAYQVVYNEPHSRAWAQAGWMAENQRFVDALPELPPLRRDAARAELGLGPEDFVVAHAAYPHEAAAEACVRAAVAKLPGARRLRIAAAPDHAAEPGTLHAADPRLVAAADAYIHQACEFLRDEPVLQAVAAGLPLLATAYAQHADLVQFGASAIGLGVQQPARLAKELARLRADPERRRRMGAEARHWLASRADESHVLGHWSALLLEAAELGSETRALSAPMESFTKSPGISVQ